MLILRENGFSLLELMVVVAVAGIVASLSVPMLTTYQSYNHAQKTNALLLDIKLSRSEAVKRNTFVSIRRTGGSWQTGWISFVDNGAGAENGNGAKSASEDIVFGSSEALEVNQLANGSNYADYIRFGGDGSANIKGWLVMTNAADASLKEVICVTKSGRIGLSNCPTVADPCEFTTACP